MLTGLIMPIIPGSITPIRDNCLVQRLAASAHDFAVFTQQPLRLFICIVRNLTFW